MPPAWQTHKLAHKTILKNAWFFTDDCLDLGSNFTVERACERKIELISILDRAKRRAKRHKDKERARAIHELARTLSKCAPLKRCGSLSCPECGRAFQCAEAIAHSKLAGELQKQHPEEQLAFVTIIPVRFSYTPDELINVDIPSANRWFKDKLRSLKIRRPVVGAIDISWEKDRFQLHWHIGIITSDPLALNERLDSVFPPDHTRIKPVEVRPAYSHGFIPYSHKLIEVSVILRKARRTVPNLFLALHRTEPLSTLIMLNVRLSTLHRGIVLRSIQR